MSVRINAGTVIIATIATLTILLTAPLTAQAQDKMGSKMDHKMESHKMGKMMKSAVYVSKDTRMYYSEADAKKMKMMDSKGKKLMKMDKAPMGYKMGHMSAGKMDHKMDKMDKMNHKM